jgi:hypothetical protein
MMQSRNSENQYALMALVEENHELRLLLTEWVTAPLSYGKKRDLLERTRLLVEGWK